MLMFVVTLSGMPVDGTAPFTLFRVISTDATFAVI